MVLLEVPEGTVEIPEEAHNDRTDITVARIPASAKSIGAAAFHGCSGITTLHLAEGLESIIGAYAFNGCRGIVALHLPASLRSIKDTAFGSCTGITFLRIPHRVQTIGPYEYAFSRCSEIADLDLPEGLLTIGDGAFHNRTGLETLVLPSSLTSIDGSDSSYHHGSFAGCTRLARALAPDALAKGDMAADLFLARNARNSIPRDRDSLGQDSAPFRDTWGTLPHAPSPCVATHRACVRATALVPYGVAPKLQETGQGALRQL